MFLLFFDFYDFKAVITVFEWQFMVALLDIMFEELRYFYILMAVFAVGEKSALSGQMQIIQILIFETIVKYSTVLARGRKIIFYLFLYLLYFR